MIYKTKSAIIGRKKRENDNDSYPCFVSLFNINNPHTSGQVPEKIIDFPKTHKVIITGLDINYLLEGNDLVINDLESIEIECHSGHLHIKGKQKG